MMKILDRILIKITKIFDYNEKMIRKSRKF